MKAFPLFRSQKSALLGTLLIVAPMLIFSLSPLTGIYTVMIALFFLPLGLCMVAMTGGLLPLGVSALGAFFAMFHLLGQKGLLLTAVYVLPILAVFVGCVAFTVPWKKTGIALILAHIASLTGVYLLLQSMTGNQLYTAAGEAAMNFLAGHELGDAILYTFYQSGMITLPEALKEGVAMGALTESVLAGALFSDAARKDLLLSMSNLISTLLTAAVPSVLISQSLLGGLGCLYIPLRAGFITATREAFKKENDEDYIEDENGRKKLDFPDLGTPPLSLWHMPRGVGFKVFLALAIGFFLSTQVSPALAIAGTLLYTAASTLYVIQGVALINFTQKAKGTKRFWRILLPALLMTLNILSMVGMVDQFTNIRRLRKPREPKED